MIVVNIIVVCLSDFFAKNYAHNTSRRGRNKKSYSPHDLMTAVKAVQDGSMNAYQASTTFGVPRRTISYRVKKARERFIKSLDMMELRDKQTSEYVDHNDEQVYLLIDEENESESKHNDESIKTATSQHEMFILNETCSKENDDSASSDTKHTNSDAKH